MNIVDLDGTHIHYQVIGAPEGRPTLVFSNSLGTDFRIWRDVIVRLVGEVGIVMYDKRGHGLSDVGDSPYAMEDHVSDLIGLLDHLGAEKTVICGLSVGGMIAQGVWRERPDLVAGLVLTCTQARFADDAFWDERIANVEREGLPGFADAIVERWFSDSYRDANPLMMRGWRNLVARQTHKGYVGTCHALRNTDYRDTLADIDVPTLVVGGEEDPSCPPDAMVALAKAIPEARYESIKRCGHIPCVEEPDLFAEILKAFLADAKLA